MRRMISGGEAPRRRGARQLAADLALARQYLADHDRWPLPDQAMPDTLPDDAPAPPTCPPTCPDECPTHGHPTD